MKKKTIEVWKQHTKIQRLSPKQQKYLKGGDGGIVDEEGNFICIIDENREW